MRGFLLGNSRETFGYALRGLAAFCVKGTFSVRRVDRGAGKRIGESRFAARSRVFSVSPVARIGKKQSRERSDGGAAGIWRCGIPIARKIQILSGSVAARHCERWPVRLGRIRPFAMASGCHGVWISKDVGITEQMGLLLEPRSSVDPQGSAEGWRRWLISRPVVLPPARIGKRRRTRHP